MLRNRHFKSRKKDEIKLLKIRREECVSEGKGEGLRGQEEREFGRIRNPVGIKSCLWELELNSKC